jgi:hypothetical protein
MGKIPLVNQPHIGSVIADVTYHQIYLKLIQQSGIHTCTHAGTCQDVWFAFAYAECV